MRSVNREYCDVTIVVRKDAKELPTSEVTEDTSPGIPTLGTAVQSPDTRSPWRRHWGPVGCQTAVVGAGLADDNKDAAVVEATGGSPSPMARRTGQVGVQPLSRKRLFDACNKPTELGWWPMFVNSETGRRCRGVSCNDHDSRTDLDTAAGAVLHDPHMKKQHEDEGVGTTL